MPNSSEKYTTLIHPDGRKYRSSSPAEITRLRAQGYTVEPKPAAKKAGSTGNSTGPHVSNS